MLTLAITGFAADPDLVTEILGLEPTSVGRIGEQTKTGTARKFNGWWHDAKPQRLVNGVQHNEALTIILSLLRGRENRFARLQREVQPREVTIYGGFYVPTDRQCGIWLDPGQMQLLAACQIGWGLDLFVDE